MQNTSLHLLFGVYVLFTCGHIFWGRNDKVRLFDLNCYQMENMAGKLRIVNELSTRKEIETKVLELNIPSFYFPLL